MKSSLRKSEYIMEERVVSAVEAMSAICIPPQVTRSVLKSLLKAYDDNWEYIEEENYRLLADAIFESQFSKSEGSKRKKDDEADGCENVENNLDRDVSYRKRPGKKIVPTPSRVVSIRDKPSGDVQLDSGMGNRKRSPKEIVSSSSRDLIARDVSSRDVQIASSAKGEVNLSLSCSTAVLDSRDFSMPRIEDVCKMVEDQWLSSAKKLEPKLSLMNLLEEICECVLKLGSKSAGQEHFVKVVSEKKIVPKQDDSRSLFLKQRVGENNINGRSKKKLKSSIPEPLVANSNTSNVVQQPQVSLDNVKRLVDPRDIANGQERHRIPLVCNDDVNNDFPCFQYVRHNVIYQKASVAISLARIGDEYCCKDCYGDCLKASIPCTCARETGGEYAYTSEGLLKEDFLNSYIAKYRHTQEHHLHYCQICPLERIKNDIMPERCKGHLIGTFIKECWAKCGCGRQCGNRVVQRGIRCHLEVFYAGKRKGWGLRSPYELPKGTFVCEYAGEILTNMELHERTMCATGNEKHTYPVMLDADWAVEGILEDEEALCLDATNYGNVARFMNHRCCDPNLVEIPVEIETPDHHYYHVAFFTSRKVEPYEELCWDYGIDFDDYDHPIKAFRCSCGSKQCRDRPHSKSISATSALR